MILKNHNHSPLHADQMILQQTWLSSGALLLDDRSIAPYPGINTPYALILFIRSLQLSSLLLRGETLFIFALIMISNQNPRHRNYSETISKLVLAANSVIQEPTYLLPTCSLNDSIGSRPNQQGHVTARIYIPSARP